jgi:hypothetical protein
VDSAKSEKPPDPLGKRALYWVPPIPGRGGDAPAAPAAPAEGEDAPTDSLDSFPEGKRALYSGTPLSSDSRHDIPETSWAASGPFNVRCQRCGQVSHVGLLNLLIFQLPIGVWLPRGRFDRRMTCPSCRKRSWCSVTLRRE